MRSIMIGGGVAGCAVAAALRGSAAGESRVVIERRAAGAPAGMGFILMPNGLAALDEIAPEFDWRSAGRCIDRVVLRTADGRVLSEQAIEAAVCVGRERFLHMLREAAAGAEFIEGAACTGLAEDCSAGARAVTLADGRVVEGDLFFGCDGAQSRVRGMVFPQARLGETVVKEIVSVAHAPALARSLGTAFHKFHDEEGGLAVGMLAEGDERVVWFVQFDARRWTGVAATSESLRAFAAERTQGWAPEVAVALSGTDFQHSHLWATRDLEPLAALARGNIALVGDAAHACLPFTSQGANGALVDAAVLRRVLADVRSRSGVARAFALYSGLRRPHHRRMFMEGRRLQAAFLAPLAGTTPVVPLAQVEPSAVRVNR